MEKLVNDFSIGLLIWQLLIFAIAIFGIFLIYKLAKYLKRKTENNQI